jgi:hypothetical protein
MTLKQQMLLAWSTFLTILLLHCSQVCGNDVQVSMKGIVDFSIFGPPEIGEIASISFNASDQDLDPNPFAGVYRVSSGSIVFPTTSFYQLESSPTYFTVFLAENGTSTTFVDYRTTVVRTGTDYRLSLIALILFPRGVIQSDTFPTELPFNATQNAHFRMAPILTDQFTGRITSFDTASVPEPSGIAFMTLIALPLSYGRNRR